MNETQILEALPYTEPFLFVDGITAITDTHIEGHYFFKKESLFYKGHFKDFPVTPGVLITECMAQIGLVCLGIKLIIISDMQYFRFNKLKCKVKAVFEDGTIVARGEISGIFKHK